MSLKSLFEMFTRLFTVIILILVCLGCIEQKNNFTHIGEYKDDKSVIKYESEIFLPVYPDTE